MVREQVLWWLRLARRDLERAERSLREGDRAAAVFWAQQAAEKALKAVLLALKGYFPKTHSIRRLFEELGSNLGLGREELEDAYELTQYYYVARYPDVVEGLPDEVISGRTAERAVAAARRVVEAAERAVEEASRGDTQVG
ncbi:HEPN domain protein [Pyrolobus fumarii 1A]|uniref:HEPN domain protein n=1 Tax=Pyrolobus fumarii (strain DSM 11204 / 1A) TaxID=694429 RepID=G0EG88_PYRF1|nr:HEPN domain protein [Pyrolobus fumarii 1A]